MIISTEELYNIWRKEYLFNTKGVHVKNVVNFDKIRSSDKWEFFECLSSIINRNNGRIDPVIFIKAQMYYKNYNIKTYCKQKSIQLYILYKESLNNLTTDEDIYSSVIDSIKFIANFCKDNNIKSFDEYLESEKFPYPLLLKHYESGNISKYFISIIPEISTFILCNSNDFYKEVFNKEFLNDLTRCYIIFNKIQKNRKITDNIKQIINKIIQGKNNE